MKKVSSRGLFDHVLLNFDQQRAMCKGRKDKSVEKHMWTDGNGGSD